MSSLPGTARPASPVSSFREEIGDQPDTAAGMLLVGRALNKVTRSW